jgi:hypothetical protein
MALKSLKGSVKSAWGEAGGWILLVVALWFLYSFRKLFTTVGGGVGDAAQAALAKTIADAEAKVAKAQAEAQKAKDKTKAAAATGTSARFTDNDIATFRDDAKALAASMKTLSTLSVWEKNFSFADAQSVFTKVKRSYSRLNLQDNKPWRWGDPVKRTGVVPQTAETAASVKNPYNYKVLQPFYEEVTDGRSLVADLRATLTSSTYTPFLKWIL